MRYCWDILKKMSLYRKCIKAEEKGKWGTILATSSCVRVHIHFGILESHAMGIMQLIEDSYGLMLLQFIQTWRMNCRVIQCHLNYSATILVCPLPLIYNMLLDYYDIFTDNDRIGYY